MDSILSNPTGMILDGVAASEAIDSSGETLDVKGCDISSLPIDGVINYEHVDGGSKESKAFGQEVVGKILHAKKIFSLSDCDTDREEEYWRKVKLPFIYIIYRLYDGAGHEGAKALAASIRDSVANGEPILVRLSIEGSTLERDGNRLASSVARRVAATYKPCNRTCVVGVLADPNAPPGFEKHPVDPSELRGVGPEVVEKREHEHPLYMRLGGSTDVECNPVVDSEIMERLRAAVKDRMSKALEAGSTGAAPGSLTGGATLQREDRGLKGRALAALRDYGWKRRFVKDEFRAFCKTYLPEASDQFIDHFADVAEGFHVKRSQLQKKERTTPVKPAKKPVKAKKSKEPKAPKAVPEGEEPDNLLSTEPAKATRQQLEFPPPPALTIRGKPAAVPNVEKPVFDEKTGVLHTPRGSFPMYIPSRDTEAGARDSFHHILHDPKVNEFHDYAMHNWARVNKLLRAGKLPPEVVMHATLFSQLSPNTPVPMQELMYGHLVDSIRHTGVDARSPKFDSRVRQDWLDRDQPDQLPQHSPEHWARLGDQIRVSGSLAKRPAGSIMSFMLANNKFGNMAKYHQLHDQLVDLVNRHKDDARSGVAELMEHKKKHQLREAMRRRAELADKPDPGEYTEGPSVAGLAPKTARYTYGMMGGSNVVVPDTHFVRYLFGLDKRLDPDTISYLKTQLWNENNSHLLEGIDRYYAQHHDAVRHMVEHPQFKKLFRKPEDAVFPAFWKNWVAIVPHERARGMSSGGENEYTDHRPFWEAIDPFLGKSEAELYDESLPARTATLHNHWVQMYGEVPAMALYYRHLVPRLLARAGQHELSELTMKFEALDVDLRKAIADEDQALGDYDYQDRPVTYGGRQVIPGSAFTARGKMALLGEDATHFVAVPHEKLGRHDVADMVRLPKTKQNTHFWVVARPAVPVSDLEG